MGTFFMIQNHEVALKTAAQTTMDSVIVGDLGRSFNGKPLETYQTLKKQWKATTTVMKSSPARVLVALLQGRGHVWDFDDTSDFLYSSKGLGATGATAANGSRYTTTSKFGAAGLQVAASNYVQFNVGYNFEWSILGWQGSNLGTAHHYIVTSAGTKYVDGVQNNAASTPFFDMVSGNFRLGDPAGTLANNRFDDVIVIDELIDRTWAADLGAMTAAFGPLPVVRAKGEFLTNNVYYVLGADVSSTYAQGVVDGTLYNDLTEVSFTLDEYASIS